MNALDTEAEIASLIASKRFSDAQKLFDREIINWEARRTLGLRHISLDWTLDEHRRYRRERWDAT